jgi:hypothetical protein
LIRILSTKSTKSEKLIYTFFVSADNSTFIDPARENPRLSSLTFTHIFFFEPLVERLEIAEVVKHFAILFGLRGRFTQSVCKMWGIVSFQAGDESVVPLGA